MKTALVLALLLGVVVPLAAQHTSDDFKDAAGCGPFPLYVGVGYATSRYADLGTVGDQFAAYYEPDARVKRNLRGINAMLGATLIPKWWRWKLSFAVESKYQWLYRSMTAGNNTFDMSSNQLSLGGGVRYAPFPFVLQVHYQRILFSRQTFGYEIDGVKKGVDVSTGGNMVFARLSILDPAGSDGGPGFFVEYGIALLDQRKNNEQLTDVIRVFNDSFTNSTDCARTYKYFTLGLVVPLAVRLK